MTASAACLRLGLAVLLCCLPLVAEAHDGHAGHGFVRGLLHPLTGVDHLLVLLIVGWWSAATRARHVWAVPLVFALSMLGGASLAMGSTPPAFTELAILASLLLFGALLLMRVPLGWPVTIGLVLPFAAMHGVVHAAEGAPGAAASWLLGMVSATLGLHLLGVVAGAATRTRLRWATPLAGAIGVGAGAVLALALVTG